MFELLCIMKLLQTLLYSWNYLDWLWVYEKYHCWACVTFDVGSESCVGCLHWV